MELLNKINETAWNVIFDLCSVITDNVSFAIFMTSFLAAALCLALRRKILKTRRVFGLPETLYVLSVAQMVNRLRDYPTVKHLYGHFQQDIWNTGCYK